jgi:ABC-type multidrug transport system ATPase subunit
VLKGPSGAGKTTIADLLTALVSLPQILKTHDPDILQNPCPTHQSPPESRSLERFNKPDTSRAT